MQKKIAEPTVVVFFGLTGSGKSYLASRWAAANGCRYLNSDEVRKELAGVEPDSRHHVPFNKGLYSPEMTRRTYQEMLDRAAAMVDDPGLSGVVLDGSYARAEQRQTLIEALADRSELFFILCYCSESVTRKRFQLRAEDSQAVSDGRWEIYIRQKAHFSVPDHNDGTHVCRIDTDDHIDSLMAMVDRFLNQSSCLQATKD